MGIKAKTFENRLEDIREENKDNPNYPKLKWKGNEIEVVLNDEVFIGLPNEVLDKFKGVPYFVEEYHDLLENNDFISYNLRLIDEDLKSKYE